MTAATLLSGKRVEQGVRRTDPKRDLAAVGELMQLAFGPELDASGRRMVREMKRYGQYGWFGWLLAQFMIPTAAFPRGFVWMEQGRLVGNAHMLRVPGYSQRWVIANVAVHPEFQRRGIARQLVEACIDNIHSYGAREILLQVREKNAGARKLYEQLEFYVSSTRTDWICPADPDSTGLSRNPCIRARRKGEWQKQVDLARTQYPEGLVWPIPSIETFYKPASLAGVLGLDFRKHWVWVESGRMLGSLSLISRGELSSWHLIMAAAPDVIGSIEASLLPHVFPALKRIQKQVKFSYPAGLVDEEIAGMGFVPKSTLHWMKLDL